MSKKLIAIVGGAAVVALVIVLCLFCCGGKKEQYCSVIPKDAVALLRISPQSFVEKHNVDLSGLKEYLDAESDADIVTATGLDLSQSIYAFYLPNGSMGICAKVCDADALTQLLQKKAASLNAKLSEKQGFHWVQMNDIVAAYDDERLLAVSGGGMYVRKNILAMMEQPEEESITTNPMYESLQQTDKCVAFISSFKAVPEQMQGQLSAFLNADLTDVDANVMLSLDFDNEKAILALDVVPNSDKAKALFSEENLGLKKLNGTFVSTGLAQPFAWFAMNVDGKKLYANVVQKNGLDEMLGGLDISQAVGSLNGDVTIQLPSAKMDGYLVQAEVSDNSIMDIVQPAVQKMNSVSAQTAVDYDDDYSTLEETAPSTPTHAQATRMADGAWYISGIGAPTILSVKDNKLLYLTNSVELGNMAGKTATTGLEAMKQDISNAYIYGSVDASALLSLVLKQIGIPAILLGDRFAHFDRLTFQVTSATHAELSLSVSSGKSFVETIF